MGWQRPRCCAPTGIVKKRSMVAHAANRYPVGEKSLFLIISPSPSPSGAQGLYLKESNRDPHAPRRFACTFDTCDIIPAMLNPERPLFLPSISLSMPSYVIYAFPRMSFTV
jgi:hypothetical protein